MRSALLAALLAPAIAGAQQIVLREPGPERIAAIIRTAAERQHTLRAGEGDLVLPRDSTIQGNLLVLGRRTYVSSHVEGDVVVVGGDLFLRPLSSISGRAIAIGGAVYRTPLGSVGGDVESYRDDDYFIRTTNSGYELEYAAKKDRPPMFQLAGLQGLLVPTYDRVVGLSQPVGALVTFGDRAVEIQPTVTYRSRLGQYDPGVELRIGPEKPVRLEADYGRSLRSNETWIYSDLLNSAASLAFGNDTRNYFRAVGGTARVIGHIEKATVTFEPWVGARTEEVRPISAGGNVFSFWGRDDLNQGSRPNPLVQPGRITSGLFGASLAYAAGDVTARLSAEAEQSFDTPDLTSAFTQLTLNGAIDFPTFRDQRLSIAGHAVATAGDNVPLARYAYLGRAATLPLLQLLELGGDQLLFLDSEYSIPINRLALPMVGPPTLIVTHYLGTAGVGSLPNLQQEIGLGLSINLFRAAVVFDASDDLPTIFSVGFSLPR
ncbi:MAG TPA: hypothetical protein VF461_12910 [Gemmatimonadaceae bacterium]